MTVKRVKGNVRTAVVTGGSAGIGAAVCDAFLAQDYRVISVDRTLPKRKHPRLHGIRADLSRAASVDAAGRKLREYQPTTIVHNAGVVRSALLQDVSRGDFDYLVNLHLWAVIRLSQYCLPFMKKRRFGRVVLISSRAAVGLATRTVYTATKAALIGMARTWALELGPHGITVNAIAPGPVPTGMFRAVIEEDGEQERKLIASLPMRRLGSTGDIARAVMYFADPDNGFVTGQTLFVCGGASVGYLQI